MHVTSPLPAVTVLGGAVQSGAYLLRVALATPLRLAFGRFRGGAALALPAGEYIYVGSAMGVKGATALAPRLVRHATRTAAQPPHAIRAAMVGCFRAVGLGGAGGLLPAGAKTLHWHIDYLLDQPAANLTHVIALRTDARLEGALAAHLACAPQTAVVAEGLGASDAPAARGGAHLLRVIADEAWWRALIETCQRLLNAGPNVTGHRARRGP